VPPASRLGLGLEALDAFCQTLENWLDKIANYFVTRASNGRVEGVNRGLRLILWRAFGMVNFEHFRCVSWIVSAAQLDRQSAGLAESPVAQSPVGPGVGRRRKEQPGTAARECAPATDHECKKPADTTLP
jgi:hypothetical protein